MNLNLVLCTNGEGPSPHHQVLGESMRQSAEPRSGTQDRCDKCHAFIITSTSFPTPFFLMDLCIQLHRSLNLSGPRILALLHHPNIARELLSFLKHRNLLLSLGDQPASSEAVAAWLTGALSWPIAEFLLPGLRGRAHRAAKATQSQAEP